MLESDDESMALGLSPQLAGELLRFDFLSVSIRELSDLPEKQRDEGYHYGAEDSPDQQAEEH